MCERERVCVCVFERNPRATRGEKSKEDISSPSSVLTSIVLTCAEVDTAEVNSLISGPAAGGADVPATCERECE